VSAVKCISSAGVLLFVFSVPLLAADEPTEDNGKGPQLGEALVQQVRVGCEVTAEQGPCRGITATLPVPIAWPEQEVRIADEEVSPYCDPIDYRTVAGTVQQMLVKIPNLPAGETARVVVTFEVSRRSLLPPDDTSLYVIPDGKKLDKHTRPYLGPSPYIESRHAKIRSLAKEIMKEHADATAWEQVEALYDWVRENVEPSKSPIPLKGAVKALKDKNGDCEDLSSLFIALCRASNVPARTVWIPGHCYPEFYLFDDEGQGHWFPCEPHGSRAFGGIPEHRPILQKGDNFRVPERPQDQQRYVAEFMTGQRGGGQPSCRWIREVVAAP
jgi:hypothetical protein